eukprot:10977774-Lingulodinium_polyedra.AAC.1
MPWSGCRRRQGGCARSAAPWLQLVPRSCSTGALVHQLTLRGPLPGSSAWRRGAPCWPPRRCHGR